MQGEALIRIAAPIGLITRMRFHHSRDLVVAAYWKVVARG